MEMLGLTQEEYYYYRQEVYRKGYEERDKAYRNIPDVQNGIVTAIVVSLVVGALFTVAAAALAPKPKQPKPPSVDQRKAGGTKNLGSVTGSTRFNQSFGFNSVSEVAQYGETVPLVFGQYKGGRDFKRVNLGQSRTFSVEDDGYGPNFSGGNLIGPKLVWSRVLSYGHSQVLYSLYVVASQGLPKPELESVWLGQQPIDTLYEKDLNLFWRGDDGGQPGSWRISAKDLFAGNRGGLGSVDPRNTQEIYTAPTGKSRDTEDAFCMAWSPAGQTQFGVYSPVPNTYMRLNYASISRFEDGDDDQRKRAGHERQKIWGYANPHFNVGKGLTRWMGLVYKSGEGTVYDAARGLKYCNVGDRFEYIIQPNFFENTHGDVNYVDVSNSTKEMREAADDKLQIGDQIQIGTGTFRVIERSIPIFTMSSAEAGSPGVYTGYEEDCGRRNDRYANNTAPGCRVISGVAVWNPGNGPNDYRTNYYFADQMVEGKNGDFSKYDIAKDGDLARFRGKATVTYPPGSNTKVEIKFKCGKPIKVMTEGSSDTGWTDWDDEDDFGRAAYYEIEVETASGQPWTSDKGEGGTQLITLECEEAPLGNHIGVMSLAFLNLESPNYGGPSRKTGYNYARYPQGEELGVWNNIEEWWFPLLRYNQAVIRNTRPTACTEIGIRSNVWNQMTGLCNFNTIPTVSEMDRYDDKNVQVNNGTYSTYFLRYSFFIVMVRPSGRKENKWTKVKVLFAVRGQRPVDQFNFIRFKLTGFYEGQLEFRLCPVPGCEVARYQLGGETNANYQMPDWFKECWLLGPPAQTRQLVFNTKIDFIDPGDVPLENDLEVSSNARLMNTADTLFSEMMLGKDQNPRLVYEYSTGVSEQTYYEGLIARSSDSGPEHEVMYVNESVDFERAKYNNLTTLGLNLRATGKFNSMDQPRVWVGNGRKIPIIKDSTGTGDDIQWRADYTNNYVDVVCWLLTNKTFGYGDVVSKELVDWDGMRTAAKFVDYKNFAFDGTLDSKVNLREWISSTAPLYMLNFTIANGMFSLRPAVPTFDSGVESAVQYSAIFTDTNILDDTMKISWIDEEDRAPFRALMRYRVSEKNQLTVENTVLVHYSDSPPTTPIEEFDVTDYVTTREHAISIARYYLALRRRITHKIEFETTPEMMANVTPGDYILVYSRVNPNQPSRTGVIEADGTVRMMGSDLTPGIYDGYWWNPGEESIRSGPIAVNGYRRVSSGANPICCGAVFSVTSQTNSTCDYYTASEATAVTYQVDQIEINDEGIITVNGSVYPVTPPDLNCNPLFDTRSLSQSGLVSEFEKNNRYAVVRSDISDANNGAGTGIPTGSYSVIGADASGLIETGTGDYFNEIDFRPPVDALYGYKSNYDEYQRLMEGLPFYDSFLIYTPPTIYGCAQTKNGARLVPVGYYNSAEIIYYRQAVTGIKEQNVLMYKFFYNGIDPQQYDLIALTDRSTLVTPNGVIEIHYYYNRAGRLIRFEDPMSIPGYIDAQTDKYAPMPSSNDYRSELLPRIYMGTAQCVATFGIDDEDCLSYEVFPPPIDGPANLNFWGYNATRNRKFVQHGFNNREWCLAQDRYERKVADYDEEQGAGCYFNEDREAFEPSPDSTGTAASCAGGDQRTRPYNFLYRVFAKEVRTFGWLERTYRLNIQGDIDLSRKLRTSRINHSNFDLSNTESDFFYGMNYKMPSRFNPNANKITCPKWDVFSHLEYHQGDAFYQRWYGENIPFYYQGKYALTHGNFAAAISFAGAVFPSFSATIFLGRPGLNREALEDQYFDDGVKGGNYYSDRLPDPLGSCAPEFIPPAFYTPWNAASSRGETYINIAQHVAPLQITGVRNHNANTGQGPAEESGVREEMDPSLSTLDEFHAPLLPSPVFSPDLGIPDEWNDFGGNWLYQNPNESRYFWYNLNDKFAVRGGRFGYSCPLSQVDDARRIDRLTNDNVGVSYDVSEFGGPLGRYGFSEANEVKVPRGRMSGESGILMRPDGWCTLCLGTYKDNIDTCTSYVWEADPDPWGQLGAAIAHNERQRTRGEIATMYSDASGRFYWNYLDGEQVFQSGHDVGARTEYDPSGGSGGNSRGGPMYGYVPSFECSRVKQEPVPARKEWDDPAKNWCGFKTAASSIFPDYDTPVGYSSDEIINPRKLDLVEINVRSYNLPGAGLAWAEYWCQAKGLSNTLPNQEYYAVDRDIAQTLQNNQELLYDYSLPERERAGRSSFEPENSVGSQAWAASPTHKYQFMSTKARIDWEGYAR